MLVVRRLVAKSPRGPLSEKFNFDTKALLKFTARRTLTFAADTTNVSPRLIAKGAPKYSPSALAGRKFLPDAETEAFPSHLGVPKESFPLVLFPEDQANACKYKIEDWAKVCRERIDALLPGSGAILLRRLPLHTAEDFGTFIQVMGYPTLKYRGGAGRRAMVAKNVMTASDEPLEYTIDLHKEMANLSYFPSKLLFFCVRPPEENNSGETPIADMDGVLDEIDSALLEKLDSKGVRYYRNICDKSYSNYVSWQNIFMTEDRKEVESFCRGQGYEYTWNEDHSITYYYRLPATIEHPVTGKTIWFNQITSHHASFFYVHPAYIHDKRQPTKYPFHTAYGDGEEFTEEEIAGMRRVQWKRAVGFHWQQGDVLIVDNLRTAHARLGVHDTNSQRRILASLLD